MSLQVQNHSSQDANIMKPIFVLILLALFTTAYITGNKIYLFAWTLWLLFTLDGYLSSAHVYIALPTISMK
jgi:hypothetical protein